MYERKREKERKYMNILKTYERDELSNWIAGKWPFKSLFLLNIFGILFLVSMTKRVNNYGTVFCIPLSYKVPPLIYLFFVCSKSTLLFWIHPKIKWLTILVECHWLLLIAFYFIFVFVSSSFDVHFLKLHWHLRN